MDFVAAKAVLDKFAHVFRAAEFMADALETAASLERRAMELSNNVEHLTKQQQAAQDELTAIRTAAAEAQARAAKQASAERARVQQDAEQTLQSLGYTRAKIEDGIAAAQARLADYTSRADATIRTLDQQIAAKQEEVGRLEASIETLRAQARSILT